MRLPWPRRRPKPTLATGGWVTPSAPIEVHCDGYIVPAALVARLINARTPRHR